MKPAANRLLRLRGHAVKPASAQTPLRIELECDADDEQEYCQRSNKHGFCVLRVRWRLSASVSRAICTTGSNALTVSQPCWFIVGCGVRWMRSQARLSSLHWVDRVG